MDEKVEQEEAKNSNPDIELYYFHPWQFYYQPLWFSMITSTIKCKSTCTSSSFSSVFPVICLTSFHRMPLAKFQVPESELQFLYSLTNTLHHLHPFMKRPALASPKAASVFKGFFPFTLQLLACFLLHEDLFPICYLFFLILFIYFLNERDRYIDRDSNPNQVLIL